MIENRISDRAKILLIDEDTSISYLIRRAMEKENYKIYIAGSGKQGMEMSTGVCPDLILMDIKMPNLDGLEATKIIRELSPTVPIIAQSAYAYQQDQIAATDAGCSDFIAKPISQAKLKDMINKWLP